jgi:L-lactate dehydrogenase
MDQQHKVGVLGCGNVGMAAAYTLFNRDIASDLILVDKDYERAEGEAMDMMHAQAFADPVDVRAGTYEDLGDAKVIVVAAGTGRKPGETRLDLLNRNVAIFKEVVAELDRHAPNAVLAVATNPVDVITYVIQKLSNRPPNHVIGTGTMLDTARFRALLGAHYGVDPRNVHSFIIGEHGDSEVPVWSKASIGGLRLAERTVLGKPFEKARMDELFEKVRYAGRDVIKRKGFTSSAIGVVIAHLVETILHDQHSVLTVSVDMEGEYGLNDVCLSIPCVIGHDGVEGRILPELTDDENAALQNSASVLRESIEAIDL